MQIKKTVQIVAVVSLMSMSASGQLIFNQGLAMPHNGGFVNYNKNDIAAEYRGSGIPGTRYYNPYYEAYKPTGTYFGGCGNPYGEWRPNIKTSRSDSISGVGRTQGIGFVSSDVLKAWEISRKAGMYFSQRRRNDIEGRIAELEWENKMRESQNALNEIGRESFLRVFRDRSTVQQSVMDKYNLQQLHPSGWLPSYGANPGNPNLFTDEEGTLHRVEKDGMHYEFDERAKEWYKVD